MASELAITVLDEDGTKLRGVAVTAGFLGGVNKPITILTDMWGVALFPDLAGGSYLVTVNDARFASVTRFITVWQNANQRETITLYLVRHIYFAIYYKVDDGAFQRAAQTWEREIRGSKAFNARTDTVMMLEQLSEGDFKKAWDLVYQESKKPGRSVVEGRLFTHASYGSNTDGLEFKPDNSGGTLDRKEMSALPKLIWESDGKLVLHGCNTGKGWMRDWTPAQELANGQRVTVEGLAGWGYFSTKRDSYSEINGTSQTVYLYAYDRRKNASGWGDGSKMREVVYKPR